MQKNVVQAEGKAHQAEDKKIRIPEKTHKALEAQAKAEGKTPDQKADEIVEKKAKSPFPTDAEINPYGFLHFKKQWLDYLGWQIFKGEKGCPLKITENADGSITLRKA